MVFDELNQKDDRGVKHRYGHQFSFRRMAFVLKVKLRHCRIRLLRPNRVNILKYTIKMFERAKTGNWQQVDGLVVSSPCRAVIKIVFIVLFQ